MKYRCIDQLQSKAVGVSRLCDLLNVSRAGYYLAKDRCSRRTAVCAHEVNIKAEFERSGRCYGSRRLLVAMRMQGIEIGRYRVRMLMRRYQLRPVWKRKFIATTDSRHDFPVAPNVLNRQFSPAYPNQSWASDITYIRTRQGWLYLAAVMDLFSRKIVGWSLSPSMPTELVCSALNMAIAHRHPQEGLIVHSDRGSQYASSLHQLLLKRHHLTASMSGKGNCWDNAVMERFFLNLKMERIWRREYANHAEASRDINDYIVGFYNHTRLHSALGYLSPNQFEAQMKS